MRTRPRHLRERQITGRAFGEAASLEQVTMSWSDDQIDFITEVDTVPVVCNTAPAGAGLARQLAEAGVQTDGARAFWITQRAVPSSLVSIGDIIVWRGDRYRVQVVNDWGDFHELGTVRQEPQ